MFANRQNWRKNSGQRPRSTTRKSLNCFVAFANHCVKLELFPIANCKLDFGFNGGDETAANFLVGKSTQKSCRTTPSSGCHGNDKVTNWNSSSDVLNMKSDIKSLKAWLFALHWPVSMSCDEIAEEEGTLKSELNHPTDLNHCRMTLR